MNIEDDILVERFLKKELSKKESASFLLRIKRDTDFREQFLLEKQLWQTLNDKEWSFAHNIDNSDVQEYEELFKSSEAQKIKSSIYKASKSYKNSKIKNRILYSSVAAVFLFFSIFMYNFYEEKTPQELYSFHISQVSLPAIINRGNHNQYKNLAKAQTLFENKEYKKSITLFSQELDKTNSTSSIYFYLAIAQMETNQLKKAENTLNDLIKSDFIDSEKGYWLKSLLYLKSEDLIKCKKLLQFIIDNSYYNHIKAKELISIITD